MTPSDPLLQAWADTLCRRANTPAVFDDQGAVSRTFNQVEARAVAFEAELSQLTPGSVVGVQIGNHPDWPSLLLACLRRKLVTIPLDSSISGQERDAAMETCRASALVVAAPAEQNGHRTLEVPVVRSDNKPVDWGDRLPCLLKLTSGTTAAPRTIRFRSHQLVADCVQICDTMGIHEGDVNFGVIPVSHSYGFSNLITPLLVRGVAVVLSGDRLPRAVMANLARSGATVFPGMPLFYQSFAEMTDVPSLPKLRLCISAGAPLSRKVAGRFESKFGLPIHSFYGSSECGGICYDRANSGTDEGFVGPAMKGVEIIPIDPQTNVSQIRVRSAAVADGYFPEPNEQKLGNGMFVPDDLLSRLDNGWKIVGRVSDVINVAGKKVNPAEVEAELLAVPGVREAVVFGRKSSLRHEEVAACVVANSELSENELLRICRQRLSGWQVPKRIFLLDQLPANDRGKISRRELGVRFDNC